MYRVSRLFRMAGGCKWVTSSRESTNLDGFAVFWLIKETTWDVMKSMNCFSTDTDKFSPYINTNFISKLSELQINYVDFFTTLFTLLSFSRSTSLSTFPFFVSFSLFFLSVSLSFLSTLSFFSVFPSFIYTSFFPSLVLCSLLPVSFCLLLFFLTPSLIFPLLPSLQLYFWTTDSCSDVCKHCASWSAKEWQNSCPSAVRINI